MIDAYTREELLRVIAEQKELIAHLREDLKTAIQAYRDVVARPPTLASQKSEDQKAPALP